MRPDCWMEQRWLFFLTLSGQQQIKSFLKTSKQIKNCIYWAQTGSITPAEHICAINMLFLLATVIYINDSDCSFTLMNILCPSVEELHDKMCEKTKKKNQIYLKIKMWFRMERWWKRWNDTESQPGGEKTARSSNGGVRDVTTRHHFSPLLVKMHHQSLGGSLTRCVITYAERERETHTQTHTHVCSMQDNAHFTA